MDNFSSSSVPVVEFSVPLIGVVDIVPLVVSLGLFIGIIVVSKIVLVIVLRRIEILSRKTKNDFDDVLVAAIRGIRPWMYTLVAAYVATQVFTLPEMLAMVWKGVVSFAVTWQVIEILSRFIAYGTEKLITKKDDVDAEVDPNAATASALIRLIARIVLWAFGGIFILSNLGIEVTSLIAGLGIGGIAVAFALQGVLSDLFASFSIYLDKPFRLGDFVVIGSDSGTIEKIGIKSTRIKTLEGQQLVVSNAELTSARVENYKKMERRRVVSSFGITYETAKEKVKKVNAIVTDIITNIEGVTFDRVHFTTFGDSALLFELVYHIESSEYVAFLDIQQTFNFALLEAFAEEGIDFAYPTQTIYHQAVK